MLRHSLAFALAAALLVPAARAETMTFHATMNGATEVPPKTTNGTGSVEATVDTAAKTLTYTMTYANLTGPATAAHFHGPADPGANAGVLIPISPPLASPIKGTAPLTDAQVADFTQGKVYANVHTAANPGGEIRGQMTK